MKKQLLLTASLLTLGLAAHSQVKIGDNPNTIDPSSVLELESPTQAFYINRVVLNNTTGAGNPVLAPKAGMIVYNTNAAISGTGAQGAGLYYFDGAMWVSTNAAATASGLGWLLLGNSGTLDGVNFLGTTDQSPLNFRVNNVKAGRIENGSTYSTSNGIPQFGNVALGFGSQATNTPTATGAGSLNTSLGNLSLNTNNSGRRNTAIGYSGLAANTTGDSNTVVGAAAGSNNTTGSNNTYIGTNAYGMGSSLRYTIALGSQSMVSVSNGLVLGATDPGSSTNNSVFPGPFVSAYVGIDVTDPTQRIDYRNGHIRNRQDVLPTIQVPLPAGNGVTSASVAAGSSDSRGRINTVGYNNSNGLTNIRVNFQYTCTNPPIVTVSAANEAASTATIFVTTDVSGFNIQYRQAYTGNNGSGPSASFNYLMME